MHDGPGIRTVVFLKGCPLRCRWCGNPESQFLKAQAAWTKERCIHCNNCVKNGKMSFSTSGELQFDTTVVTNKNDAENICPSGALHVFGEEKSVSEIISIVKKDEVFYRNSEGGITLSGGEPLMQPAFTIELLKEAKKQGIHCAMETSGYADWEILKEAAGLLDYILYDIKTVDDKIHKEYTGVSCKSILENFQRLNQAYPHLKKHVRTPVIPGFNDKVESISAILDFLQDYEEVRYELLKYHKFGVAKYISLGRSYEIPDADISDELMLTLNDIVKERRNDDKKNRANTKIH